MVQRYLCSRTKGQARLALLASGGLIFAQFLGTFTSRVGEAGAFTGILAGTAIITLVWLRGGVSWQWYTLIGSLSTLIIGAIAGTIMRRYAERHAQSVECPP
jgi:hypothetical protein